MRYLAPSLALLVVLLAGLPAAAPAAAQPGFPGRGMEQGGSVPFAVILSNIRRSFPGQLSDVQSFGGRHRVKWVTPDGRVLFIDVDARTGQIMGVNGGGGGGGGRVMPQNFGPGRDRDVEISREGINRPPRGDNGFERPTVRQNPRWNGPGRNGPGRDQGRGRRGAGEDD